MFRTVVCMILFPAVMLQAGPGHAAPDITAREIIENVQARYDDMSDAVMNFTQSYRFKVSKVEQEIEGTMFFKKKNKYRIETEQRIIVTDGTTSWSYNPESKQVVIDEYKEDAHSLSPERLLVNYPEDYYSSLVGEVKLSGVDCYALKLTPKEDNSFTKSIKIWIGPEWTIKKVEMTDIKGAVTTYTIRKLVIDGGIPDSRFTFVVPKGGEVIDLR